jgi:6-phosphogluconolactonase (cycloisomerase 2 family)
MPAHPSNRRAMLGALLIVVLALASWPLPIVHAATGIQVDPTANDANNANDGKCSLYEALQAISQGSTYNNCTLNGTAPFTITFTSNGTLKVINGNLPFVTKDVRINGPVIIEGNGSDRIFTVAGSGILSLANLTVRKGSPAIFVNTPNSVLNIAGVSFLENKNTGDGGAINSVGRVTIAGSVFTGNSSDGGDGGGAIWAAGTNLLNIGGTAFNGNTAKRSGGAIYAIAPANIVDTAFNGNIANGIDPNNNGSDDDNDDYRGQGGGAIFSRNDGSNGRKLSLTRVVFNGNITGQGHGGALSVNGAAVAEVQDSAFNGNLAGKPPNTSRMGGAVANLGGRLTMVRSTLLNNAVVGDGGAIANDQNGVVTLANLTITANAATGRGGGLFNVNVLNTNSIPRMTVRNVTLNLNAAQSAGGGIFAESPNANDPNVVLLANTIVAGSDGPGLGGNCGGSGVFSEGHNLESGASCSLNATGDKPNTNPQLKDPLFNGGALSSLLSHEPQAGSPVIEGGDNAICAAEPVYNQDLRGVVRPLGQRCDIGSFEAAAPVGGFGSSPVQPGPISFGNVQFGQNQQAGITVFNTGTAPLTLSNPQISGLNAVDFAVVTNFPQTLGIGANVSLSLRCQPTGATPGSRTASFSFSTNDPNQPIVAYSLNCNATAVPVPGFGSTPAAPGPLDAGTVLLGQSGTTQLSLREVGTALLNLGAPQVNGDAQDDFSVSGLPANIANGGAAISATVTCTPSAPGIRSATLSFSTNDPTTPTVAFTLTCTGRTPPAPPLETPGVSTLSAPTIGNSGPYGIALSPDGRNLYVAEQGDNLVAAFTRDPATNNLTLLDTYEDEFSGGANLESAVRVLVSNDGRNVYVTSTTANAVTAFARDIETGALNQLDSVKNGATYGCPFNCQPLSGLNGAYGMAISPDGQFLYVSSISDNAIVVLRRGPTDGGLIGGVSPFLNPRYVDTITHPNLLAAYDIVISPDGSYLYAAGYFSGNILIFARNPIDGKLTYQATVTNSGIPSLIGVFRLDLSPDGNQLYAASFGGGVTVFTRNPATGGLSLRQALREEAEGGITGLENASAVRVSPDGRYAYVTGYSSNTLIVFERDPLTGELFYAQTVRRNILSMRPALRGARDVVVAPDSRSIIASGYLDNRIVRLRFNNPTPTLSSLAPASTPAGSSALTLTLNGADFVATSTVQWNGADLPTTFVSSSVLQASVATSLVNTAGTVTVTVVNPLPGGGTSNEQIFTITAPNQNPVPAISAISPSGARAGAGAFTLTVSGAGFIPTTSVHWNGEPRSTTFVGGETLEVSIPASDIAQPGPAAISVVNPAPGGGTSNSVSFTTAAPGANPSPNISGLSPASINAGANDAFTLRVFGSNFVAGAQATWNDQLRPTMFVSAQEIQIAVNAADLVNPGNAGIVVLNPGPGGGPSNVAAFVVLEAGANPIPALSGIVGVSNGTNGARVIRLSGSGFVNGITARWNGQNRPTTFVNAAEVTITVSAADLRNGSGVFSVVNPGPGGGASSGLLYRIHRAWAPVLRR